MNQGIIEPIVCETAINLLPDEALRYFTRQFGDWWPRDYTFSKKLLSGMYLGQAVGEWCYEQGPHGFRCDWGRILEWNPPRLVAFTWQIGPKSIVQPDPDQCTEVRVQFSESAPNKSGVKLTHKYFERHGADAAGYRADMASDYGWPLLLQMFAAAAHA
jgi:uncharacterized protein YndB with AHSA1/START domain